MSTTLESIARAVPDRQPAWGIALLYPDQGTWSEDEYLSLSSNQLVEFTDGSVEVLPMPTPYHQMLVASLFNVLNALIVARNLGQVLFAPLPVKVAAGKFREPDIVFKRREQLPANPKTAKFWEGADLVVEVMSEGAENRERDLVTKRAAYAAAGIEEYWIVDPEQSEITVLTLQDAEYTTWSVFKSKDVLTSRLLPELNLSMNAIF